MASDGTCTRARGPAARMRSPWTTTTESSIGGAPLPSISRAPEIAIGGAGSRWASSAAVDARTTISRTALRMLGLLRCGRRACEENTTLNAELAEHAENLWYLLCGLRVERDLFISSKLL